MTCHNLGVRAGGRLAALAACLLALPACVPCRDGAPPAATQTAPAARERTPAPVPAPETKADEMARATADALAEQKLARGRAQRELFLDGVRHVEHLISAWETIREWCDEIARPLEYDDRGKAIAADKALVAKYRRVSKATNRSYRVIAECQVELKVLRDAVARGHDDPHNGAGVAPELFEDLRRLEARMRRGREGQLLLRLRLLEIIRDAEGVERPARYTLSGAIMLAELAEADDAEQ